MFYECSYNHYYLILDHSDDLQQSTSQIFLFRPSWPIFEACFLKY